MLEHDLMMAQHRRLRRASEHGRVHALVQNGQMRVARGPADIAWNQAELA